MGNELAKIRAQVERQRKVRVLIIDDDLGFCELLRIHLSLAGFAPEVAVDGVEGGKALLAHPPDLVLCDLQMPFMSGLDLLSLMRTDPRTASIPVILVSGHSDEDTIAKAIQLGAADFLIKPLTVDDLMQSISACLTKRGRKVAGELLTT